VSVGSDWLATADRSADWSGVRATVAGLGDSGFAASDALLRVGARVEVIEARELTESAVLHRRAEVLETLGASVIGGADVDRVITTDLLVPSPGLAPHHPWIRRTHASAIWSGEQLAWQLRPAESPWLTVTGTNGKTTTVQLVNAILNRAGYTSMAVGNIGVPMAEAVFIEPLPQVFVVELSSYQLHFTHGISAHTSALLNVATDHLDWHGSSEAYELDKSRVFNGTQQAIVYNHDDARTERLAEQAEVLAGCRAIGFTLGVPQRSMVGVVDGVLVDRAFVANRSTHATEIVAVDELPMSSSHIIADMLAATAVARSFGVSIAEVRQGVTGFALDDHRGALVATVDEVNFVDNSKATNVHAADVALSSLDSVVWIAGGLAKGGTFDDVVAKHAARFRAAVLLGQDQGLIAEALQRHAPEVPVFVVPAGETDPMLQAVRAAATAAQPHDTVLLAPACASMDQFADYRARGRAFADAVARLRR
jgi:UDP-N-acetylmuramoylalanine--D-glutamate ligase